MAKRPRSAASEKANLEVPFHPSPRSRAGGEGEPLAAPIRVAGIGASAGGLDAFLELVSAIPADTGLAFVVIQHLDPRHESMLAGILAGAASIPVREAVDRIHIECDHIYVIPPDTQLTISGDELRLIARKTGVPHRPLDVFFRSLASERAGDAIGVVLSGNDTDGALGLRAIRQAGGTTFAQTVESAKFAVMPRAAAEDADFVLAPRAIAERLVKLSRARVTSKAPPSDSLELDRILQLLRVRHSVDFSRFKHSSIERRIQRRVLLGNHDDWKSYADFLEADGAAVETLYQDLLIGVTSFFREPERFDTLKKEIFPQILKQLGASDTIRLWVAGCSTGEEVYSLAMALTEFLDGQADAPRISIYGTDVNGEALKKARAAIYAKNAVDGLSPERLRRFFTSTSAGFKITRSLREVCVFALHDITRDPPFSKINLATCCNVLIYFGTELQKKALALLQYSLVPGGFLMLGSSETLRSAASQLSAVCSSPPVYRKRQAADPTATFDFAPRSAEAENFAVSSSLPRPLTPDRLQSDDDVFLARQLAPCGVLVNELVEITRVRGDVSPFIALEPGDVSLNLFSLIQHHEILAELRPAFRHAVREQTSVTKRDILVVDGEARKLVTIDIIPCPPAGQAAPDRWWVLFRSTPTLARDKRVVSVRRTEVDSLRRALASAIEDRENLADEATAAAEEAKSSDEELRSTNEELETAKEELQSANEELSTFNDELRSRNSALVSMNDDVENLLGAVEIPIIFLGRDLTLRRFNLTAGLLFNLRGDSVGLHLRDARSPLDTVHLEKLAGAVMDTSEPADVEILDSEGEWRLLRIRAYRTCAGMIDGAIIAVLDINELKRNVLRAEEATRAAKMLSQASALLASSLDYETTLDSLTRLSTSTFADWCAVDLVNEDGTIRHLTCSHANPVMRDLALQFQQAAFSDPERSPGAPQALRLRKSVFLSDIAEWKLTGIQPEPRITQLIGALGVRSLISVPLIVRDKVLGTTTFSSSSRLYEQDDLELAEELSQRAAVAIDTALLFREAESANRYKDAFLGTVAHELRTPLTSILGWTQIASGNEKLAEEALIRIDESAKLLRLFVEDLLDITRIREQKFSMEIADVDVAEIISSGVQITSTTAAGRGVEVRFAPRASRAIVRGDRVRLLQVVWNLLSNALKFTPPGGTIDIRLEEDGADARLSVIDNGCGISPEFAPHVFEFYRQGESRGPGLGIGLAIVSQIVKLHEGTVTVDSAGVGRGSTFVVTLPLCQPESLSSSETQRNRRAVRASGPDRTKP